MPRPTFTVSINAAVPHLARSLGDVPELAAEFERLGADQLVLGEHLLVSPALPHPGAHDVDLMIAWPEPFALLAAVAARTSRIGLTTGGILGATRPAVVVAKLAATLDALSQGRFTLGVVAGWYQAELEASGVPFGERFARIDEMIAVCRALWGPQPASFSGRWTSFHDALCQPQPVQGSALPIWFGGRAGRGTSRRVGACDGWIVSEAASVEEIRHGIALIEDVCRQRNRPPEEVGVRATLPRTLRAGVPTTALSAEEICDVAWDSLVERTAVGVTDVCVPIHSYATNREAAAQILSELRTRFDTTFGARPRTAPSGAVWPGGPVMPVDGPT